MKKQAFIITIIFILTISLAHAITLQTTLETQLSQSEVNTNLIQTNTGLESPFALQSEIIFHKASHKTNYLFQIPPNEKRTYNLTLPLNNVKNGTHHIFIKTNYLDKNGRKHFTTTHHPVRIHKETQPQIQTTQTIHKNTLTLIIQNNHDTPITPHLTFITPQNINIQNTSQLTQIPPYQKQTITLPIKTTPTAQNTHTFFTSITYTIDNLHYHHTHKQQLILSELNRPTLKTLIPFIILIILITLLKIKYNIKQNLITITYLILITLFLLLYIKPHLLLSQTTPTGGDMASHIYTASLMKHTILPQLKLSGYSFGNYAGAPVLFYYFPLPFALIALLGYAIPLTISFKLITILGTLLLPIAIYIALTNLKQKHPVPLLAAAFSLLFLFNEANTMWGGNIPSTLAGEFAQSLSLIFAIILYGTIYHGITKNKLIILNITLVTLMLYSHIYPALIIVPATLTLLITKHVKQRLIYLLKIGIPSLLLILPHYGPWFINLTQTIPHNFTWNFTGPHEVLPKILLPILVLALLGIYNIIKTYKFKTLTYYLLIPTPIATFFFLIAKHIGLVDIRLIPFIYLWAIMYAPHGILLLTSLLQKKIANQKIKQTVKQLLLPIFIIITFILIVQNTAFTAHWIKWNYEGIEEKINYPLFNKLNTYLSGSFNDPRIVYEHSSLHNTFGTERAFENLPFFANRQTLEGLYLQASLSSPFIFYIQSELSKQISCPFYHKFHCTTINPQKAAHHLKLFNVNQIIAISDVAKQTLNAYPEFKIEKQFEHYTIYNLTTNQNAYVTVLQNKPVALKTKHAKDIAYHWFTQSNLNTHVVFLNKISEKEKQRFTLLDEKTIDIANLPKTKLQPTNTDCKVTHNLENNKIEFQTDCTNKPHLIKVSYHPRWKVQGADQIYYVSPSFMLVYPNQEHVHMHFS